MAGEDGEGSSTEAALAVGRTAWARPLLGRLREGPSTARDLAFGADIDAAEAARRLHRMRSARLVTRAERDGSPLWSITPTGRLLAALARYEDRRAAALRG